MTPNQLTQALSQFLALHDAITRTLTPDEYIAWLKCVDVKLEGVLELIEVVRRRGT